MVDKDISLSLGFSRDGFQYVRPQPRFDFVSLEPGERQYYPSFAGGLFCVLKDHLHFYVSSLLRQPNGSAWHMARALLNHTASERLDLGQAHLLQLLHQEFEPVVSLHRLRRDGFASLTPTGASHAVVRTRLLQFNGSQLFINAIVPPGDTSSLLVRVLSENGTKVATRTMSEALDSTAWPVELGRLELGSAARGERSGGDSSGSSTYAVARLEFELWGRAELFSFWFAGESAESHGRYPPCIPTG